MNTKQIHRMQSDFDSLAKTLLGECSIKFWFARDLQEPLGYARWVNFMTAIQRAVESCEATGHQFEYHFRGVTKMVALGSGAKRRVEDFIHIHYHPKKYHLTPRYQLVTFSDALALLL